MKRTANPYPNLPDALTLKNGARVTTPAAWWDRRRPEIVEDFEREVLGRVPGSVPRVVWTVTRTASFMVGGQPVVGKQLTGHVDNASYPAIAVDIQMALVVPGLPGLPGRRRRGAGDDDVWRRSADGIRKPHDGTTRRRRVGLRVSQPDERASRQRRGPDDGA